MLRTLIGDYTGFFDTVLLRLAAIEIDVSEFAMSHLAVRVANTGDYLNLRAQIEEISTANVENVWNGRPISKLLLQEPVKLGPDHALELVELIPPTHNVGQSMGIEHVGFVVGERFDDFTQQHADRLTGQQDQGPFNQPVFIRFDDSRSVKFHRRSLHDVAVLEGHSFDGMHHSGV